MNRKTASLSLAIPVGVLLGSLLHSVAEPSLPVQDLAPMVGVVDLEVVRDGYPRAHEMLKEWLADQEAVNTRLQQGKGELDKLQLEANGWDAYTPEWIKAQSRVRAADAQLGQTKELEERRLIISKMRLNDEIYQDIERAVEQLAKKKGLSLVLRRKRVRQGDALDNRMADWQTMGVLYHAEELDLSQDVINFLKSPDFAGDGPGK